MSLRDFNEPSRPLSTDAAGNGAGLNSFHTTHPEERQPSHMPQIIGAVIVALMVGTAAVGLYAYSSSFHSTPAVASYNNLPLAPAAAPQQAANTPAESTAPAATPAGNDSAPVPAPAKEASTETSRHHRLASKDAGGSSSTGAAAADIGASTGGQTASNGGSARMSADSTQASQAPASQAAVEAPSEQAAPQPSPSDLATNNTQSGQAVPQGAATASDMPAQNSTAQQQPAPAQ